MDAVRCVECGGTRWSLLGRPIEQVRSPCELCGGQTVVERRRPGRGNGRRFVEKRVARPVSARPVGGPAS